MPTVLRVKGYRVFFFSEEGNEPVHVHVRKAGALAKFWLNPVKLAHNEGFKRHEVQRIIRLLEQHEKELVKTWNELD